MNMSKFLTLPQDPERRNTEVDRMRGRDRSIRIMQEARAAADERARLSKAQDRSISGLSAATPRPTGRDFGADVGAAIAGPVMSAIGGLGLAKAAPAVGRMAPSVGRMIAEGSTNPAVIAGGAGVGAGLELFEDDPTIAGALVNAGLGAAETAKPIPALLAYLLGQSGDAEAGPLMRLFSGLTSPDKITRAFDSTTHPSYASKRANDMAARERLLHPNKDYTDEPVPQFIHMPKVDEDLLIQFGKSYDIPQTFFSKMPSGRYSGEDVFSLLSSLPESYRDDVIRQAGFAGFEKPNTGDYGNGKWFRISDPEKVEQKFQSGGLVESDVPAQMIDRNLDAITAARIPRPRNFAKGGIISQHPMRARIQRMLEGQRNG